jgi:hypothetical protein
MRTVIVRNAFFYDYNISEIVLNSILGSIFDSWLHFL